MENSSFSFVTYAGIFILALACSGENPAAPGSPNLVSENAPVTNAIKSEIAANAGNAIASNLEDLVRTQVAAVGSFAVSAPSSGSFEGDAPASSPSSPAAGEPEHPDSSAPASQPPLPPQAPAVSESCSFNAAALIYSCVRDGNNKRVVKSYQFLDA